MIRPLFFLVLCVSSLNGCASLKSWFGYGFKRPDVHLLEIEIKNASLSEVQLGARIKIVNQNDYDISLARVVYNAESNSRIVAEGIYNQKLIAKRQESIEVVLPLTIHASEAVKLLTDVLEKRKERFVKISATLSFETAFGVFDRTFSDSKSF